MVAVMVNTKDRDDESIQWKFQAVHYSRWGDGYNKWWCHRRKKGSRDVMVKSTFGGGDGDAFPTMPSKAFEYVVVYTRVGDVEVENFKLDMHRSLGGQCSLFCDCQDGCKQPLIMSGMIEQERRDCMSTNCKKRELYMCSRAGCNTRVCKSCFEGLELNGKGKHVVLSPDTCPDIPTIMPEDENDS